MNKQFIIRGLVAAGIVLTTVYVYYNIGVYRGARCIASMLDTAVQNGTLPREYFDAVEQVIKA